MSQKGLAGVQRRIRSLERKIETVLEMLEEHRLEIELTKSLISNRDLKAIIAEPLPGLEVPEAVRRLRIRSRDRQDWEAGFREGIERAAKVIRKHYGETGPGSADGLLGEIASETTALLGERILSRGKLGVGPDAGKGHAEGPGQ